MAESQHTQWLLSMPACSTVSAAMQKLIAAEYVTSDQHKDATAVRQSRDDNDTRLPATQKSLWAWQLIAEHCHRGHCWEYCECRQSKRSGLQDPTVHGRKECQWLHLQEEGCSGHHGQQVICKDWWPVPANRSTAALPATCWLQHEKGREI